MTTLMRQTVSPMPARTAQLILSDTTNALLRIMFKDITKAAADASNDYHTITADNNGSDASKLIILINVGVSATNYTQYQFSAAAAAVADPSGIDASPTHTQVTTLGALIKAVNALNSPVTQPGGAAGSEVGITVRRLHAPADYSLDSNDFIDIAETAIPPRFTEMLFKDASEVLTSAFRLGVPDNVNGKLGKGRIELIKAVALVNSNSGTDCTFKISYDPNDESAADEVELAYTRLVPDATITTLFDEHHSPAVVDGPVLIEITATVSMAVNAYVRTQYRSSEY